MHSKRSKYFLKTFFFFHILLVITGCSVKNEESSQTKQVKKPNIVYILTDDLGYGDLGSYGQKIIKTPYLDKMAAEGIRFTQHYAGAPVCAPSRASLMTGRDTGHCWVRGNYETGPRGFGAELELRPEDKTIGELLQKAGYNTAMIGKWGMGMDETTGEPNKKGFDYSYGFLNQAHAHWQFPQYLYRNGKKESVEQNSGGKRSYFSNDIFTDEALGFIKAEREKPFFLYLAYTTPHAELLVPEDSIFDSYKGKFKESPFVANMSGSNRKDSLGYYRSQEYPFAAYAAMITHIDNDVHKIINQLKQLGLDENTIVMFSSDNGPHKEGGAKPEYFDSNGEFRGIKRNLNEGGIRMPFIARWPGHIKPGQISDHISAFWDILPTMADIAGVDISDVPTEGISLLPTLLNDTIGQEKHDYLYWEFHERKYSEQAVRKGDWKVVRHDPDGKAKLYNLKIDPSEEKNLAADHPDILSEMESLFERARTENPYWKMKCSGDKNQKATI